MFNSLNGGIELRSFPSLIKHESIAARELITKIDFWIEHKFKKGNFEHIDVIQREILTALTHFENIKVYVQREEYKQLKVVEQFLHKLFEMHVLEKLNHPEKIKKLFKKTVSHILKNFLRDARNEKKLLHDKEPRHSFWKNFQSHASMNAQVKRDAIRELRTSREVDQLMDHILHASHAMTLKNDSVDAHFYADIEKLTQLIVKEFDLCREEFLDAELEEFDILHTLGILAHEHKEYRDQFHEIRSKIHHRIKKDIASERRELHEVKTLRHLVSHVI